MFCLFEPNSDQEDINDFDPFAEVDDESNNICYYIEFTADDD